MPSLSRGTLLLRTWLRKDNDNDIGANMEGGGEPCVCCGSEFQISGTAASQTCPWELALLKQWTNGRSLARKRNVRDKAREATGHHEKELLYSRLITYVDPPQTF